MFKKLWIVFSLVGFAVPYSYTMLPKDNVAYVEKKSSKTDTVARKQGEMETLTSQITHFFNNPVVIFALPTVSFLLSCIVKKPIFYAVTAGLSLWGLYALSKISSGQQLANNQQQSVSSVNAMQQQEQEELEKKQELKKQEELKKQQEQKKDSSVDQKKDKQEEKKQETNNQAEQDIILQDRILGGVLGGCLGDAFGAPTEFLNSYQAIFNRFPGGVKDITQLPKRNIGGRQVAPYTDDTGMAKIVLSALVQTYGQNEAQIMDAIARIFIADKENNLGWAAGFRAPGNACLRGVQELSRRINAQDKSVYGEKWWRAGAQTAGGCGSVMRVYPFGIIYRNEPEKAIQLAVEHSRLTHGAPIADAACAAMTAGVIALVNNQTPEHVAQAMIAAARVYDNGTAIMLENSVEQAQKNMLGAQGDVNVLFERSKPFYQQYQGWAAHEAIAAALYTFLLSPNDIKGALFLGANTPGDSDSIASIAATLVGLRVGAQSISQTWIEGVEGAQELTQLVNRVMQVSNNQANNVKKSEILEIH